MESHHDLISLFEHDLRVNAFRVCREGKPVSTFPDHALGGLRVDTPLDVKRFRGYAPCAGAALPLGHLA
jgi:hypothetical protein